MSRFDRCDERVPRESEAERSVTGPGSMAGVVGRGTLMLAVLGLAACATTPAARSDRSQPRVGEPVTANEVVVTSEETDSDASNQVSLVPSREDFAGIATNLDTPPIYATSSSPDAEDVPAVPVSAATADATPSLVGADQERIDDAESVEVAIVEGDAPIAPDLQRIQSMLRRLAAEADDPVPYHLAASILPVIGMKGSAEVDPEPFLIPEAELDGEEAAMLGEVAAFATGLRARIDAGESTRDVLLDELEGLLERLERGSRLTIAIAELCREVRGAGDYELLPRVFASGRPQEVLIYVDLDGEEWTEIDGGDWEWAVDWKLELHQVSDRSIADQTEWNRQRTRRAYPVDDNYLLIRYTIPAEDLASALYVLKVRFREPGTKRETETGIRFQLVPRRSIAVQGT